MNLFRMIFKKEVTTEMTLGYNNGTIVMTFTDHLGFKTQRIMQENDNMTEQENMNLVAIPNSEYIIGIEYKEDNTYIIRHYSTINIIDEFTDVIDTFL